ncbi:MAG: hypothetical protein WCV62_01940 [Candidatus Peribacteraceae bacterium]
MLFLLIVFHLLAGNVHAAQSARFTVHVDKDSTVYSEPVGMILRCYGTGRDALAEFFVWTGRCTGSCSIGPLDTLPGDPVNMRFCNVDATVGEDRYTAGAYPVAVTCTGEEEKQCVMRIDIGLMRTMQKLPEEAASQWDAFFTMLDEVVRKFVYDAWCTVMGVFKKSC